MPRTKKPKRVRVRSGYVFVEMSDRAQAELEAIKAFHEHVTGEKTSKASVLRMAMHETYVKLPESFQNSD